MAGNDFVLGGGRADAPGRKHGCGEDKAAPALARSGFEGSPQSWRGPAADDYAPCEYARQQPREVAQPQAQRPCIRCPPREPAQENVRRGRSGTRGAP